MHVSVISIGNSKGIRIPKAVLDQLKITDSLEMEIVDNRIVLQPVKSPPRTGWESQFRSMAQRREDTLLMPSEPDTASDFEWEW